MTGQSPDVEITAHRERRLVAKALLPLACALGFFGFAVPSMAQPVPAASMTSLSNLVSVTCPTVSTCEAVGTNQLKTLALAFRTTNGGKNWKAQALPAGVRSLDAIACATATTCEAVGFSSQGIALGTTNGGATWTTQDMPANEGATALACPKASTCEAVGSNGQTNAAAVLGTTNGGATWALQSLPSVVEELVSIACPKATTCEAGGYSTGPPVNGVAPGLVLRTSDGGTTWEPQALPTKQAPIGVACPSASICQAIVAAPTTGASPLRALRTTNGGTTWTAQSLPSHINPTSIACPGRDTCEAVGTSIYPYVAIRTTNGGTTWKATSLPMQSGSSVFEPDAIACAAVMVCQAVGGRVGGSTETGVAVHTINGGKTWTVGTL